MAYIIETPNPFEPLLGMKKHQHEGGITIWQWLELTYPGFEEFPMPTVCILNGEALKREEWTRVIRPNDIINFISFAGELTMIIIFVIAVIVMSILTVLSMNNNPAVTPGNTPASAPVFSTSGQNNTIRVGEPIEVCYGRNRVYPSLAAQPSFEYIDNDQFQQALFCLGQGEYEIEALQIGDTPIDNYQEVEYEIIPPGGAVTLFATNIVSSVEAGGHTLFAPNEPEYVAPGWQGPFPANPSTTLVTKIEIDLVYPKGVYYLDSNGVMVDVSVIVEAEYRLINDAGAPLGAWALLFTAPDTFTAHTTTAQRRTLSFNVAPGRYEVRMRRTDTKIIHYRAGSDTIWEGMRGWIDVVSDFGNVTLWAVRIRATNNLNNQTETKFNAIITRKLPIRDTGGWTAPMATRSIVWAFVDVMKSVYGGRISSDTFFDWDTLEALDALYASRGDYFDWIFRDAITVWDAAKSIATVGRAVPLLVGSILTLRRDGPLEIPVTMFTPENIIGGTFQWDVKLWDLDEFDSIEVEYTDPTTGYLQETVIATLPFGTTDHPEQIRLAGCQDRAHAYREGLYLAASRRYLRENITFETGMEGFIPSFGDLVAISHDLPRWGQSGYVLQAVVQSDGQTWQLFLSEPLKWDDTGEYQILLRGRHAEIFGPYIGTQTSTATQVIITIPSDTSGVFDFLTDGTTEPMLFLFGITGMVTKYGKIVKIEPKGGEIVVITAVNDAPIIHSFDDLLPSELNNPAYAPKVPGLPVIDHLYISQSGFGSGLIQAAWSSAFGAQEYIIQTSSDGVNWEERARTTRASVQLQSNQGTVYIRVAALNRGQGPWIQGNIVIQILIEIISPWDPMAFTLGWNLLPFATDYTVKVYDDTETAPVLKRTIIQLSRAFTYNYDEAKADGNLKRDMLVTVETLGSSGQIKLHHPLPSPPSAVGYELISLGAAATYRIFWTLPLVGDLKAVRIWLELASGYDPASTTPYANLLNFDTSFELIPLNPSTAIETFLDIPLDSDGTHPNYYLRVGVQDVWGTELTTNVSAEQVLSQPT